MTRNLLNKQSAYGTALFINICLAVNTTYSQGIWVNYTQADGLASNDVREIFEDHSGNIWFGTLDGASVFDGSNWQTQRPGSFVEAITQVSSGDIWLSVDNEGIYVFDGTNWTNYTMANGLSGMDVLDIVEDQQGNIWASNWGRGVDRYDGTQWQNFNRATYGLGGDIVNAVLADRNNNLWFGCQSDPWFGEPGGVTRYDGTNWANYTTADGLIDDNVISLYEDHSGNIWVGTFGGVSKFDGTNWTNYNTANGLANNSVFAITQDTKGQMWFATYGGGVSVFDGTNWKSFTTADGLISNSVDDMIEDSQGNFWFATPDGVSKYTRPDISTDEERVSLSGFEVYPNPFTQHIIITFNRSSVRLMEFKIVDLTGRELYSLAFDDQTDGKQLLELDLTALHLPKGNYIMTLTTDEKVITQKIIKD